MISGSDRYNFNWREYLPMCVACLILIFTLTGCSRNTAAPDDNKSIAVGMPATIEEAKIGNVVKFGTYEQDGNTQNGSEGIEWLVLDIDNNKLLLLSTYVLDAVVYCDYSSGCDWKDCNAYRFLTKDFLNSAFSTEEREKLTYGLLRHAQDNRDSDGPYQTEDKVFALNFEELEYYSNLVYSDYRSLFAASPTEAIKDIGTILFTTQLDKYPEYEGKACYWTRTDYSYGCYAEPRGLALVNMIYNDTPSGIRPAIWVSRSA